MPPVIEPVECEEGFVDRGYGCEEEPVEPIPEPVIPVIQLNFQQKELIVNFNQNYAKKYLVVRRPKRKNCLRKKN